MVYLLLKLICKDIEKLIQTSQTNPKVKERLGQEVLELVKNLFPKKAALLKENEKQICDDISILLEENKRMGGTIQEYSQQIKDVSSRNEKINVELDKIMTKIPETQSLQNQEIQDLKKNLDKTKSEKKTLKEGLKKLQQEVIPGLKNLVKEEQIKTQELDKKMEVYSFLEKEYTDLKNLLSNERKSFNQTLRVKDSKITEMIYLEKKPGSVFLSIQSCLSFAKELKPRVFHSRDIENIPSRIFIKNPSNQVNFQKKSSSMKEAFQSTEAKVTPGSNNTSFQNLNTTSTNKNKETTAVVSEFLPVQMISKNNKFKKENIDLKKIIEHLKTTLLKLKDKLNKSEGIKKQFKKCKRCLILNQELLEEEKQELVVQLEEKRKKWKRKNSLKKLETISPEMAKVLFGKEQVFQDNVKLYYQKKKKKSIRMMTEQNKNSICDSSAKKGLMKIKSEVYSHKNNPFSSKNAQKECFLTKNSDNSDHFVTPRMRPDLGVFKKNKINTFYSNKIDDKIDVYLTKNKSFINPIVNNYKKLLEINSSGDTNELLSQISMIKKTKSISSFVAPSKRLKEQNSTDQDDFSRFISKKRSRLLDSKISERKRSIKGKYKKNALSLKPKEKTMRHNKGSYSIKKNKSLTQKQETMLVQLLNTLNGKSKGLKKKQVRSKIESGLNKRKPKKKTNCIEQLLKKSEIKKLISHNMKQKKHKF